METHVSDLFLFGTLLDDALRGLVAGCDIAGEPAVLPGHGIWRATGGDFPVLAPGVAAHGLLLRDVPDSALARLHFYEQGFGYVPGHATVETDRGALAATVYLPGEPVGSSDIAWVLSDWQAQWGPMTRAAATEVMTMFGTVSGAELRFRMPMIRVRADSALRAAAQPSPVRLRRGFGRDDVRIADRRRPYVHFFALDETDLTHTHFDGSQSGTMTRAGLHSGDAVTLLPYDPVRDRVLLVEQFRFGPLMRGDPLPWCLEAVAGRIDPGETPDAAARREAEEEAGITLQQLLPIASHYPSPGALSEYLFSFIGLCDLPHLTTGQGGLAAEHEDIRTHVLPFADLMALIDSGEVENSPLILSALWLDRRRAAGGFA